MASKSKAVDIQKDECIKAILSHSTSPFGLDFTYFNAELPLSAVAAVTGTTNSNCNTVKMWG